MAGFLKSSQLFCLNAVRAQYMVQSIVGKRWQTSAHTLSVKKRINDKREKALEAGGQRRIDNQHKMVNMSKLLLLCGRGQTHEMQCKHASLHR